MKELSKSNLIYRFIARDILVFVALWLYLWLLIDVKLIYNGAGRIVGFPTFFGTLLYLKSFMINPAGLVGYISSFLSQLFYYSWLGSVVISLICWINAGLTVNILHRLGLRRFDFLRFCSTVFVIITFALYLYQFDFLVAIMVVLILTAVYVNLKIKNLILDLIVLIILSSLLYTAAGGSFYVFAFIAIAYLITQNRLKTALLYSALAVVTPYLIGCLIFKENLHNSYCVLTPLYWKISAIININKTNLIPAYIFYSLLPLTACFVLVKIVITKKYPYLFLKKKPTSKSSKMKKKKTIKEKISSFFNNRVILRYCVISFLWIAAFAIIVGFYYKSKRTKFFLVDYYYMNRNWPKVVESARSFQQSSYYVTHAACHGLYQMDKLTTEMFAFPQHPYSLFLNSPEHIDVNWSKLDVDLDLGFLNLAEHGIIESMQAFGPRPVLLKKLATILLAKRDYKGARVYLNQLSTTLFERSWANDYLNKLQTDPDLEHDSRISYLRSVMMTENYGFSIFEYDKLLGDLLEKNPKNKMAFEYLMAWHLLCGNIEEVVNNFYRMDNLNYKTLPEYYQQAYLFYTSKIKRNAPLEKWKIDDEVLKNYNEIVNNYNLMRQGNKAAYNILSTKHNHSYLVYLLSLPSFTGK